MDYDYSILFEIDRSEVSMSKIYLINVGANSSHQSQARCPIRSDGTFVYVPFPFSDDEYGTRPYPSEAWKFTNGIKRDQTHADPDWKNLTYGDYVANARAASLRNVCPNDILLFWSLLWKNDGTDWDSFENDQSWHLIGALRVEEILRDGQSFNEAKAINRRRAKANAHFGNETLEEGNVVFIGEKETSALFHIAVPLVTKLTSSSLLYRAFRTAAGDKLPLVGKHWSSYTRSCRAICELNTRDGRRRAMILRDAIQAKNVEFDLLSGI